MTRLGPMCPACGIFRLGAPPDWRAPSIYSLAAVCPTCAYRERSEGFFGRNRPFAKTLMKIGINRDAAE
jgi:hypothetical protein